MQFLAPAQRHRTPSRRLSALVIVLAMLVSTLASSPASAHAEIRQASPARGEVVGGAIHSITMQFFDLDVSRPVAAAVFDPAGNELAGQVNQEDQRVVIALIDPIASPGEYLVTWSANGVDGDFTEDSFSFFWEEGAPEPAGINLTEPVGIDTVNYVLLLVGAALAAFIVSRFMTVRREIRLERAAADVSPP